jgi:hypothetical protein
MFKAISAKPLPRPKNSKPANTTEGYLTIVEAVTSDNPVERKIAL